MNLLCCCTMAPNTRITRKWELFAGRNRFYCDGLLMSAPHTGVFYLTCFLITGTSTLFFAFDCPYLATRITPAIPIVGAVLYFFTMSSLLRTTFTDPGVIPRASHDEAAYIEKQIEVPNSLNSPTYRPPPRTKEVLVKGQTVKLKYCFTCKIFRPPRASHCSLCDNCVDRFDHHCPWVGNCVGKRNYRFFYMFLVSLAFLAVFIFSCSVTHLVLLLKIEQEVFEVIKKAPFSVIVTFICFFSIWSVIGLAGFHTYLTTSDQTTNEDLKGSFSSKGGQRSVNPYSRGNICLNCFHILCGPMTPSLIDRRGIVTDEYMLQMQHSNQNNNQNNQLTNVTTTAQPTLITSQPVIGSIDQISTKQRVYDDFQTIPSAGIYRHRSYDNLQNGNSNSLAHLVDNEIPLSTIESPVTIGDGSDLPPTIIDDDNINESINKTHLNNLSGSYNNLFRDNLDNYNCEQDDIELKQQKNNFQQQPQQPGTGITTATSGNSSYDKQNPHVGGNVGINKSASESENVYSNIPITNLSSSAISSSGSNRSDPNLHVYSNLIEEKQQQIHHQRQSLQEPINITTTTITMTTLTTPTTTAATAATVTMPTTKKPFEITNNIKPQTNKSIINKNKDDDSINDMSNMSSTMLIYDLDLDDPVSAFVTNNRKKYEARVTSHHKTDSASRGRNHSLDDEKDSQITPLVSIEQKMGSSNHQINSNNIINNSSNSSSSNNNVSSMMSVAPSANTSSKSMQNSGGGSGGGGQINSSSSNESSNFITPSRLRHLHDTTMIDTALDLDSLDGSSIGNNSQACLVNKTAIV